VLVAGWQDLFLQGQLGDYLTLRDAGRPVRLVIGDWTHHSPGAGVASVEALFALRGPGEAPAGPPVRLEVGGGGGWLEPAAWPVPATEQAFTLAADRRLTPAAEPGPAGEAGYVYDPHDPTPQAGGRALNPFDCGRLDQRLRESRADVLVFTGEPLDEDLTICGTAQFEARFQSEAPSPDLFLRLCDADAEGVSTTVADGYLRVPPGQGDGTGGFQATVDIGPTAYRFQAGHRLRLQVSSGAHPLHLRNSGSADAVDGPLVATRQSFKTGPAGCRLVLPVL
jgi:putative CocE/NonD family hydrolase